MLWHVLRLCEKALMHVAASGILLAMWGEQKARKKWR